MKISKVLAGISALSIAASMSLIVANADNCDRSFYPDSEGFSGFNEYGRPYAENDGLDPRFGVAFNEDEDDAKFAPIWGTTEVKDGEIDTTVPDSEKIYNYPETVNHDNHSPLDPIPGPYSMSPYLVDVGNDSYASNDLFGNLKVIHDADSTLGAIISFKAAANQNGVYGALFLQSYEPHTENGKQVYWVSKDNSIIVGTDKQKVQDRDEDGNLKYEQKEVEDYVYLEDGSKKITGYDNNGNPIYATEKKKVNDYDKPIYVMKWVDKNGNEYKDDEVSEMYAWHNYYVTENGILDTAPLSLLSTEYKYGKEINIDAIPNIDKIRKANGMYFDDNLNNTTYGHFFIFGDKTKREYSFRISAEAISAILEKAEHTKENLEKVFLRKVGEDHSSLEEHGRVWLQTCTCTSLSNVNVRVDTMLKTEDEVKAMVNKFLPVSNSSSSAAATPGPTTGAPATTVAPTSTVSPAPSTDSDSDNTNPDSGTATGLGITGILSAAVSMVVSKRH